MLHMLLYTFLISSASGSSVAMFHAYSRASYCVSLTVYFEPAFNKILEK